jgi:NADPH-dependent 2,4-dienoyl-CoA reductase/sulfur reductase-like enzyme
VTGTVVVVGSSVAGVRTAQDLRTEGHDGPIVLIGAEEELPYDKPPLSKQLLAGSWDRDRVTLLTAEAAATAGIDLRLGVAARRLDVAGRVVVLADGERVPYDTVVIATGAAARPSPWVTGSGVHVVRTLADCSGLRAGLADPGPVVVVGGGFIGAEVAATAHAGGRQVTVVDPLPVPIGRVVGSEVGRLFADLHARHGVGSRFGVGVEGISGRAGALRVQLTDGTELAAGTVVVGIGTVPNDAWLADSGLLVDDGVVCDEHCRAVDAPDVFAAGDVARWFHPGHGAYTRVEHWTNAVEQAGCVAHNVVHPDDLRSHRPVEYVWSDQYDWRIQIVGRPHLAGASRLVGEVQGDRPRFAAVYPDAAGALCAAVTVNWPRALATCRRLVATGGHSDDAVARLEALAAVPVRPSAISR